MSDDLMVTITVPKSRLDHWLVAEACHHKGMEARIQRLEAFLGSIDWRAMCAKLIGVPETSTDEQLKAAIQHFLMRKEGER